MKESPEDERYGRAPVADVLDYWRALVVEHDYWSEMTLDDRDGELRRLVSALLRTVLLGSSIESQTDIVWSAADHGTFRRRQGVDVATVDCDIAIVADGIRRFLRREPFSRPERGEMRHRLALHVRLARHSASRGFLRFELEGRGEWPRCLELLVPGGP